jgi:membrane-bound serine protease (ClpP class)
VGWRRLVIGGLIAGTALLAANQAQAQNQGILVTEVTGPITPAVAHHLELAVAAAAEANSILVVTIDTPGGLDISTRQIVQGFFSAPVPVVAFVQPAGARAASAGTFIVMSAHVAAMAPATTIGAATPIDLQTGEEGSDKIINDSAAFAVSVAEERGRDAEFAEAAVREGRSITATVAAESNVVDLLANDLGELLAAIDGMQVEVAGAETTITTAGLVPQTFEMSMFGRILTLLADPNIAVLFLSLGTLAIIYEAANPGLGFAGAAGIILLLLGFLCPQRAPDPGRPVSPCSILAAALFIGELFVPGVGVLAAGGTIALLLSGVFLFEGDLEVSPPVLWPTALLMGLFAALAGRAVVRARLRPSTTGPDTLLGRPVTVQGDPEKGWSAFLEGSWWTIRPSSGELQEGDRAEVVGRDGLELLVDPIGERDDS